MQGGYSDYLQWAPPLYKSSTAEVFREIIARKRPPLKYWSTFSKSVPFPQESNVCHSNMSESRSVIKKFFKIFLQRFQTNKTLAPCRTSNRP